MGLYEVPMFMSMMLLFSDVLYMLMRYESPCGPMCLRCLLLTLSGPVELFYCRLDLCCGECYVGCRQFECFPIYVSVLCLIVLVNCLLNAFAICVGEVNVFSLKVMVLFLLANPCIVFQRVCVLCLYEGCDFRV